MKKILRKINEVPFIKNVIVLASGTALAQVITIILLPLITRIYGPETYGLMSAFIAVSNILIPISSLSLPIAIILPKKDIEAISIVNASLKISFIMSFTYIFSLSLFFNEIVSLLQAESISRFLFLLPLMVILTGLSETLKNWLIRTGNFKDIAKISFIQPLVTYGSMVIIGVYYPSVTVLIFFTVLRSGIEFLMMYVVSRKSNTGFNYKEIKVNNKFKEVMHQYKDFPLYRTPDTLLNAISLNLPVIMLTIYSGTSVAGFYALGRTALSIPGQLIGNAVGSVIYPKIAEAANNKENLSALISKATLILFGIGIFPFGIFVLFGPAIFSIVFGEQWREAGEYSRWIAILTLFMFINKPAIQALPVINAQGFQLLYTTISTVVRTLSLLLGLVYFENSLVAISLYSVSSAILYLILIICIIYKSKIFMEK